MNKKEREGAGERLHRIIDGEAMFDPVFLSRCADRLTELESEYSDKWPGRWAKFCITTIITLALVLFCFIFFDVTRSLFF